MSSAHRSFYGAAKQGVLRFACCGTALALSALGPVPFTVSVAEAQVYDPETQSPLSLLKAPSDPLAYYEAREKVRALLGAKRGQEAETLAEKITRDYPRDGENWLMLGRAKSLLKKHSEAAAAFERAGGLLNWGGDGAGIDAAISHLQAGNRRAALQRLRHYITAEENMNRQVLSETKALAPLMSDPEFMEMAAMTDASGLSRDDGWRRDIDYLRDEVKRLNADYRNSPLPTEFERRYQDLKQKVPQLSDEEIYMGMNRLLAVLGQGHTSLSISGMSHMAAKALPFQFYAFPEGIFIVEASDEHKDLIGARLISIEGVPAEQALRKVNETQSVDGSNEHLFFGAQWLRSTPHLVGLGIAKSTEAVQLTVQKPGRPKQTMTVGTPAFNPSNRLVPLPGITTPLFLQEMKRLYWHQPLPDHDALYVQLNSLSDGKEETVEQYALRLRTLLENGAPKNLILDLRHNGGGSTNLYAELLRTFIGFSLLPERRLYVLIGRRTYSAAGNFATELEQLANATFVGEASSECCTLYASPSPFLLPFSKISGRMATKRWSLSRKAGDFRRELNPHAPVMITAKDYFSGRDPVMEAVAKIIVRNKGLARTSAASGAHSPSSK